MADKNSSKKSSLASKLKAAASKVGVSSQSSGVTKRIGTESARKIESDAPKKVSAKKDTAKEG